MRSRTEHRYVVTDDEILVGEPIVKGTRTLIRAVAEIWRLGVPLEEIPRRLPHLTLAQVFTAYTASGGGLRAKLSVDLPIDVKPASGQSGCPSTATSCYRLTDDIVLRNTSLRWLASVASRSMRSRSSSAWCRSVQSRVILQ